MRLIGLIGKYGSRKYLLRILLTVSISAIVLSSVSGWLVYVNSEKAVRKVLTDPISDYAKNVFERIGENYRISISEWNHDLDHVHVLFKAHPNSELSKFINAYKSASSRLIKRDFPDVKKRLWKEYFWSQSFCLITVGGAPLEGLKTYIENQGKEPRHG